MIEEKCKEKCSGCTACVFACPQHCIQMKMDDKGFLYPVIDHNVCVECGICDAVCAKAGSIIEKEDIPKAYGAYALDDVIHLNSSSGGFFPLLAKKFLNNGGVVCGAAMSDDFYSVHHIIVEKEEYLFRLRGSKYLQSDVGDTFRIIKELLINNRKVLFSGTPCQVAGLKAFLEKDYNNLFCVDFICHGVPSPFIWKKYCEEIEERGKGKIVFANFRDKTHSWIDFGNKMGSDQGGSIFFSKLEDPYLRLFLKNFSIRPSCFECRYKGINRRSDITIADFWGVRHVNPNLFEKRGVSLILAQTQRGQEYIESISAELVIEETDAYEAANCNKASIRSVKRPDKLDAFWKEYTELTIRQLADKYAPISNKSRLKLFLLKSPLRGLLKLWRKGVIAGNEYGMLFGIERE